MLSFNYQAPMYSFMTLVDNINYHEEVSLEKVKTKPLAFIPDIDENRSEPEVSITIKERIITYYRNELLVIYTTNIAYIFIEDSITYVVNMKGERSIVNESLDHLITELNPEYFFRVNSQVIIRMSAIKKTIQMDKGLKIQTYPPSYIDIFVGRRKELAFKAWLQE